MSNNEITITVNINEKVKSALCTHFDINLNAAKGRDDVLREELANHLLKEIICLAEAPLQTSSELIDALVDDEVDELA